MPALKTFANLWTLWAHPAAGATERSPAQKVAAVAEAGFDGVMGEPGQGIGGLASANGLSFIAFSRVDVAHDFTEVLSRCRDEGAAVIQVHLGTSSDPRLLQRNDPFGVNHWVGLWAWCGMKMEGCRSGMNCSSASATSTPPH